MTRLVQGEDELTIYVVREGEGVLAESDYEFRVGPHVARGSYDPQGYGALNHAPTLDDERIVGDYLDGLSVRELSAILRRVRRGEKR